jgi:hypothetical protein
MRLYASLRTGFNKNVLNPIEKIFTYSFLAHSFGIKISALLLSVIQMSNGYYSLKYFFSFYHSCY